VHDRARVTKIRGFAHNVNLTLARKHGPEANTEDRLVVYQYRSPTHVNSP
jgi:hypothetical protein